MNIDIFVHNVKKYCQVMGISPSKACSESGAGKTLLDNVKRGRAPSIDSVQLLAQYLGVTVSELLGEPMPERQELVALSEHLARSLKDRLAEDSKAVLSQTALLVASAYDKADEGTQTAVRKLLDVEAVPQESRHTKEAM